MLKVKEKNKPNFLSFNAFIYDAASRSIWAVKVKSEKGT